MFKHTISIAIIAVLFSCHSKTESKEETTTTNKASIAKEDTTNEITVVLTDAQYQNAGIKTGKSSTQPVYIALKVNGVVEAPPEKIRTISFPMGGYVKSSSLIQGMHVNKGALLATLEDASFIQLQQDYLTSKANLAFAEADFERQQELNKTQSSSQKVYQQAKADYEREKIAVRALEEKLRLIGLNPDNLNENNISRTVAVYAPISAYVAKINVNPGKYIAPTDVLFELVDPSEVHVSLTVFENDARNLHAGQKVLCTVNGKEEKKIPATIHLISPTLDENRSVEVHCDLDRPEPHLLPGTFINAEIQMGNKEGNTLPDDAIVKLASNYYVFIANTDRQFTMHQVTPGNSINGYTEVTSSLPDKEIVLENAYTLLTLLKNKPEED